MTAEYSPATGLARNTAVSVPGVSGPGSGPGSGSPAPEAQDAPTAPASAGWETDCSNGTRVLLWSPRTGQFFSIKARCQRLTRCSGCRSIMARRQVDVISRKCGELCDECSEPLVGELYVGYPTRDEWKAARERRGRIARAGGVARGRGRPSKNDINSPQGVGSTHTASCRHFSQGAGGANGVDSIRVTHRNDDRLMVVATHDLLPTVRRGHLQEVGVFTPHPTGDALALLRSALQRDDYARRDCTNRWRIKKSSWLITAAKGERITEAMRAAGVQEGVTYSREQVEAVADRIRAQVKEGG